MESTQQKVSIPRTNKKLEHVFSKGPFLHQLFNEQEKEKKPNQKSSYRFSSEHQRNSPHSPRRQILSINISVSSEVLEFRGGGKEEQQQQLCAMPVGPVLPRGSVQGDDVGRAAAAGDDAGLGPARGANVRAALVVAGGGDDAARRAAC